MDVWNYQRSGTNHIRRLEGPIFGAHPVTWTVLVPNKLVNPQFAGQDVLASTRGNNSLTQNASHKLKSKLWKGKTKMTKRGNSLSITDGRLDIADEILWI